ncbi:hypothetical protein L227DRAFT_86882 [Lentinus tigrinus ALCF2SS1-6]|uniref:Uncharacterized protein n=1 Tax=Lentinus tigrinus ALCF2SS1-6 TaxID=1328759 RepID=A0A5C2SC96_9APHY|nr:hypothetical protein L227DRAFT_86882 [Lentinus tigrinus ALCF2SS1-6]
MRMAHAVATPASARRRSRGTRHANGSSSSSLPGSSSSRPLWEARWAVLWGTTTTTRALLRARQILPPERAVAVGRRRRPRVVLGRRRTRLGLGRRHRMRPEVGSRHRPLLRVLLPDKQRLPRVAEVLAPPGRPPANC